MATNLFYVFLFSSFFIDPSFFLGKWKLEKHGPINSILQSEALAASDLDDQIAIQKAANLYLKNHYLEFKKDTDFWTDVEPGDIGLVKKIGKWHVSGDTLVVMDYEKIFIYKYLTTQEGQDFFTQNLIFSDGQISKGAVIFSRIKE